jgi:hypothetical protein
MWGRGYGARDMGHPDARSVRPEFSQYDARAGNLRVSNRIVNALLVARNKRIAYERVRTWRDACTHGSVAVNEAAWGRP